MTRRILNKPKPFLTILFETLQAGPSSMDSLAAKLSVPREKVRIAMEKLVQKKLVAHEGKTAGNRYIYRVTQETITPIEIKTDPAAAWMFNEVMR
jgi:predicted transcriptional regulator